jgi:hypothetical protein
VGSADCMRRHSFPNDGSFPRWRATTSVAGSLAIVGEGSWGRKIRRFGGRIRCPRTRICDVRLACGRWRQRRVDRRRRHVGSFLRRPTGQVELGGTLRVLSSSLRLGRLGCDGAHCQTLLVAGPTMVVGPGWPFLLLLGCGAAPVRRLGGVALGGWTATVRQDPGRRMDLPGPTTLVGTRTDYSVGPWDYSACATRHLKAWSTRTTQE